MAIAEDNFDAPRVAIDFETSGYYGASACALGITRIEANKIVKNYYTLVRPPIPRIHFTHIHGLTWKDLAHAPTFAEIWPEVAEIMKDSIFLLAHNATFDRHVLQACCEKFGCQVPNQPFLCTLKGARKYFDIPSKNLGSICEHLGIDLQHHHAGSDANACAQIYLYLKNLGISDKEIMLNAKQ